MAFTVEYSISGGSPNYIVNLIGATNLQNIHSSDGDYSFTGVTEGTWNLNGVDSIGCIIESIPIVLVATP